MLRYAEITELQGGQAVESFYVALNAVVPLFLMIGIGCLMRQWEVIGEEAVRQANSLCFRAFMSVMMFYNVYTSDMSHAINLPLILYCIAGILVEFGVGYALITRIEKRPPVQGVMIQSFFRSNAALLGVSMTAAIFTDQDISEVAILTAVSVSMVNIMAVMTFEVFRGGKVSGKRVLRGVAKNPLVDGTLLGILASLMGLRLPSVLESTVSSIASATTPMALVLLGASLDLRGFGSQRRNILICLAERLVVSPAIFITLAVLLGFRGIPLAGIMVVFAGPVAIASFTVASEMGGDSDLAAELVVLTTGFACFTMFGWIFLLTTLGLF